MDYDHLFLTLDYRKLRNAIPEELFPEVEGSLMGGGRVSLPFPVLKTELTRSQAAERQ